MNLFQKLRIKQNIWRNLFKAFYYDAKRFEKFATTTELKDYSEQRLTGYIIARYHIIEKGLSMPEMRFKFGLQVIESLIISCNIYYNKFGYNNCQVNHAIDVLNEYLQIHIKNDIKLDSILIEQVNALKIQNQNSCSITNQSIYTNKSYFENKSNSFPAFAKSRHSLRHYSLEDISIEKINNAIKLAQETTPTSCNRQSIRVHLISTKNLISNILNIQTGNRGFGHLTNKLIVLSSEVSVYNEIRERNLPYIDSGIYAMNLLYSLHYFEVGACALNWSANVDVDIALRKLLNIPESEYITLIIACGKPADEFKLASSVRYDIGQITKYY